ncbi:hypothetical protein [Candidatus Darwinibacter acetoxidans]
MSSANSERFWLIWQFVEMALDLEAAKEDIRHEYHAWFAELAISSQLYEDDETFSKAARIVDLEARVLAKVTDEHRPLAVQVFRLVQQWLEQLDATTRRYIFEGGPSRRQFVDRVVQYTICQINT